MPLLPLSNPNPFRAGLRMAFKNRPNRPPIPFTLLHSKTRTVNSRHAFSRADESLQGIELLFGIEEIAGAVEVNDNAEHGEGRGGEDGVGSSVA